MTENKGSSQPKMVKWEVQSKKNKNVKRTIIKIIGFLLIAFIVLVLLGILLFAYYAWKAPHLPNLNYKILNRQKFTTEMVT